MKTVHVAAAIIEKDHQILIAKRLKGTHKDLWEFPSGKIEENESSKQALIREIKEELGLDVVKAKYMSSRYYQPKDVLMLNFIVVVEENRPIKLNEEIAEARWCSPEEALQLIRKGTTAEQFLVSAIKELKRKI